MLNLPMCIDTYMHKNVELYINKCIKSLGIITQYPKTQNT